jgi:uncharacterized protein (TIGR02757 family)
MELSFEELKGFLDEKAEQYNCSAFVDSDPVSIPHRFTRREDIEVAGFLTAVIAWGSRPQILKSASKMMDILDNDPSHFVIHHSETDLKGIRGVVHRTFQAGDLVFFLRSLRNIYEVHGGPEKVFAQYQTADTLLPSIHQFRKIFLGLPHDKRTEKHISDPLAGSAAKRINMFLRWMVRNDSRGVDFGLWKSISPSILSCPLDLHSGKVARKLGLIHRKQNDTKALAELDHSLRLLDPSDPVKYDFALFGLGAFEKF